LPSNAIFLRGAWAGPRGDEFDLWGPGLANVLIFAVDSGVTSALFSHPFSTGVPGIARADGSELEVSGEIINLSSGVRRRCGRPPRRSRVLVPRTVRRSSLFRECRWPGRSSRQRTVPLRAHADASRPDHGRRLQRARLTSGGGGNASGNVLLWLAGITGARERYVAPVQHSPPWHQS
jgi:hypothetical protein